MNILHDDLVNMVYSMVYGKRKLKFLQEHVLACLSNDYYTTEFQSRELNKQKVLSMMFKNLSCQNDEIIFLNNTNLTFYDRDEIIEP